MNPGTNRNDLGLSDDFEFPDTWEELPEKARENYFNWSEAPWQMSLKYSHQCAYLEDIPADAVRQIKAPIGSGWVDPTAEAFESVPPDKQEGWLREFDKHFTGRPDQIPDAVNQANAWMRKT
jgi:hypothetical protein